MLLAVKLGEKQFGPAYAEAGQWRFDVAFPAGTQDGRRALLASFTINGLLKESIPWWVAQKNHVAVLDAGGRVATSAAAGLPWFGSQGGYLLPPGGAGDGLSPVAARAGNPLLSLMLRSANNLVRADGGTVNAACSVLCTPTPPSTPIGPTLRT